MSKRILSPYERKDYGVIVTAKVGGQVRMRQGFGAAKSSLEDAIWALERIGPIEEVISISTESQMLTSIGRSDLVAPKSQARYERERRARIKTEGQGRRSQPKGHEPGVRSDTE